MEAYKGSVEDYSFGFFGEKIIFINLQDYSFQIITILFQFVLHLQWPYQEYFQNFYCHNKGLNQILHQKNIKFGYRIYPLKHNIGSARLSFLVSCVPAFRCKSRIYFYKVALCWFKIYFSFATITFSNAGAFRCNQG